MVQAQEWLDQSYPQEGKERIFWKDIPKRSEITKLNISEQKLTGSLNLSDFTNLKRLSCDNNQLTELILPQPNQLWKISAKNNLLTTINWTALNPNTLISLDLK